MSSTYERVQEESYLHWQARRKKIDRCATPYIRPTIPSYNPLLPFHASHTRASRQYNRVSLIREFKDVKTAAFPPLNLLIDIPLLLWWIARMLRALLVPSSSSKVEAEETVETGFRNAPNASILRKLRLRELESRDRFLRQRNQELRESDKLMTYMTSLEVRLESIEREGRVRNEQLQERLQMLARSVSREAGTDEGA